VRSVRRLLAAIALIAALVGVSVAPALAAAPRPSCGAVSHACCHTPSFKSCCPSQDRQSNPGTPAESSIQLAPTLVVAPVLFTLDAHLAIEHSLRPHTAPQRGAPLDLPTFLSTLLI
jgi:hypothetical protein